MRPDVCTELVDLADAIEAGAALAFVTEESLLGQVDLLASKVESQPSWSDFPFVVLATRRVGRRPGVAAEALRRLGNVMLLERPLDADTLASAARSALRARERQYATRRHMLAVDAARQAERLADAEALRAREALEVALQAGELGTFHCPFPLGRIEWNDKCKEHFWLAPDAEVDFDRFFASLHPDDIDRTRQAIQQAIDGEDQYDVEYRTVSSTQTTRWLRAKGRVYRDAAGQPTRFDGVTIDISQQKRFQAEREALLLAEREARIEAERAGRMKDEFLATLSHELRTPLSSILGWAHLLRRPGASDAEVQKAAATIERNALAQARLIEDLLDISRISSGTLQLQRQPVAIGPIFLAVIESLSHAAQAKRIEIHARDETGISTVMADGGRLQQILWNLVSNSIKFTPAGGSVGLLARQLDGQTELSVTDTGSGIAADFLPHVFERFRQADSSTARSFGGLGLGLAIVRQLAELHGGQVSVTSPGLGQGTTVTVTLPAAPSAREAGDVSAGAPPAAEAGPAASLDELTILVVDDETDGRDMLVHLLERQGATVQAAGSAEEALAMLDGRCFDLLVSDIGMPVTDGYELMRRVRARPELAGGDLPAIALTAFASVKDAAKARAAGFGLHLAKPVEPAQLFVAISRLCAARPAPAPASA